jgi:hypothetical protein
VANGLSALHANTSGADNVANGYNALYANTTGNFNSANGYNALPSNTTGIGNTGNGSSSLQNNTTGNFNSANGYGALATNATGAYNTAIGYNADVSSPILTNATAIGANAVVSTSNSIVLGASANVGIGTSSPTAKLEVNGTVKITDGSQGANKILTSDAAGLASWQSPAASLSGMVWTLSGNTVGATDFLGSTNAQDVVVKTNNIEYLRITSNGSIL